jgi:DNA polymerase
VNRPVDAVIEFLQSEQAHGTSHVFLDSETRDGLRELYIRARKPIELQPDIPGEITAPQSAPQSAPQLVELIIEGEDKPAKLESVKRQAANWAPARALGTLCETLVFATGNPDAKIMLIGEAPGYHEEREVQPFVGPAGQKLGEILHAMDLTREDIYISNLVKFRPATPKQTTNNRKPTSQEMAACLPLVMAEIEIIKPAVIIALGVTTAEGLLNLQGAVGNMRGKWHEISGIPARVTYHPSYLLQSGSNEVKRALWEDMLAVMEKIGMPISERQRRFFLAKS